MRFTVAAVQFEPAFGAKAENLAALLRLTREAARAGARLVVLPEMATTGYRFRSRGEIAPLVEPVPDGPTVQAFVDLALELGIHVVISLAEVEPAAGAFYNTAVLVGPMGYIGRYRKLHSYVDETRWARDGDLGIPVFETELGRIAMLVCMDLDYMESARVAALGGADLIAFPNNWMGDRTVWRARALENGVYVVSANRWGQERGSRFCGHSGVIDPQGAFLSLLTTGEGLTLAEVDTDLAGAARQAALAGRRPDLYHDLLRSTHLWHWREAIPLPSGRPVALAVGEATLPERMADQVRWADKQARDRGWPKLDLALFPLCEEEHDWAPLYEVAERLECYIIWGYRDPDGRDQAELIGPSGQVGRHLQAHGEPGVGLAQDGFPVFDLPWGRVGMLVGEELRLPESARLLAKQGADLIAVPARWSGDHDRLLWKARAMENDTPLALANALGGSCLYQPGPGGAIRTEADGSVALALVDTSDEAVRTKELLRKLQPRWYEALVNP